MWPSAKELTAKEEAKIAALVKKACTDDAAALRLPVDAPARPSHRP
jgi:hypothetical protein